MQETSEGGRLSATAVADFGLRQHDVGCVREGNVSRFTRLFDGGVEPIALARHGHNEGRVLWVGLDLATQPSDEHVDAPVKWFNPAIGYGVQQRISAQHRPD